MEKITNMLDDEFKKMRRPPPVESKMSKTMPAFVATIPRPVVNFVSLFSGIAACFV